MLMHQYYIPTAGASLGLAQRPIVAFRRGPILVAYIQKVVAEFYEISLAEMTSARRSRRVSRPRQVAMFFARELTPKSLPDIGNRFGGRDHTTVIHALKTIERLIQIDGEMAEDVERLREMFA